MRQCIRRRILRIKHLDELTPSVFLVVDKTGLQDQSALGSRARSTNLSSRQERILVPLGLGLKSEHDRISTKGFSQL